MPPADGEQRTATRWLSPDHAPDPAVAKRGRLEVGVGVGLVMAGTIAIGTAAAMELSGTRTIMQAAGIVVWQGIMSAGVLAGSHVARAFTLLFGGLAALGALGFVAMMLRLEDPAVASASDIVLGTGMLLLAIGSVLSTLAPAARAWHDLQVAARKRKREARSLAEWRSAPGGHGAGR